MDLRKACPEPASRTATIWGRSRARRSQNAAASPPAAPSDLADILDRLAPIRLVGPDLEMVRRAVEARRDYGVHFYDGMIVAAAERGRCGRILSEDFNAGQKYFGVIVENPFRTPSPRDSG